MAKAKEITLAEFMQWLEGIEEFKERNWSPDAAEWKRIRNKMKAITIPESTTPAQTVQADQSIGRFAPPGYRPPAGDLPPGIPPAPEIPSAIPSSALNAAPTNSALSSAAGAVGLPKVAGEDGQIRMKTPDVEGDYSESTFG